MLASIETLEKFYTGLAGPTLSKETPVSVSNGGASSSNGGSASRKRLSYDFGQRMSALQAAFNQLDVDGSGSVSVSDVENGIRALGLQLRYVLP